MKVWYTSKTLWFNALVLVIGALAEGLPQLKDLIPADVYPALVGVVAAVNFSLRTMTSQPVVGVKRDS